MSKLTENDRNYGPITIGPWTKTFTFQIGNGGAFYDADFSSILMVGFGWAVRIRIPDIIKPRRVYGVSLTDMGNGYDFLQIRYGLQTGDSSTDKSWSKHLPWKQWSCVRHSVYRPNGQHYTTEQKGKWMEFFREKEKCPKSYFEFLDYDGEKITASCVIEEREWHRGEGWFKWLKYFYKPKIRRSLDIDFSSEVGKEKGSWKGGITGHGITMLDGETPKDAFQRYCQQEFSRKGKKWNITFLGQVFPTDNP